MCNTFHSWAWGCTQENWICNIGLTVREVCQCFGGPLQSACHPSQSNSVEVLAESLMLLLCSACCCACAWQASRLRVCACRSSLCIFKRRGLTFILVFLSQTMGGYGREEVGRAGVGCGGQLGCGMKLGAVEGSHTAERADRGQHRLPHTHPNAQRGRSWPKRKRKTPRGGGGGEEEKEEGESAGMAMYEPAYLPPNAEEQDFIQAYENVREKYKGGSPHSHYSDDSYRTTTGDDGRGVFACVWRGRDLFICLLLVLLTLHRCKHVTVSICTLQCLWSRRLLCVCVCLWNRAAANARCISWLLSVLLIGAHARCHSSTLPLSVCAARARWIYRRASLWYVTVATNPLCWPPTSMRLREGV